MATCSECHISHICLMIRVIMRWSRELCTDILAFTLQLRKILIFSIKHETPIIPLTIVFRWCKSYDSHKWPQKKHQGNLMSIKNFIIWNPNFSYLRGNIMFGNHNFVLRVISLPNCLLMTPFNSAHFYNCTSISILFYAHILLNIWTQIFYYFSISYNFS